MINLFQCLGFRPYCKPNALNCGEFMDLSQIQQKSKPSHKLELLVFINK